MGKCTLSDIEFYGMDGFNATYVVVRIELDQPVEKSVMAQAYEHTCKRFPYFQTRLKKLDYGFSLVANEKKPVMHEDAPEYLISAAENDGFLYRFSIWENTVSFSMFHGLSDGSGAIAFLKVVLTEYYKLLGETVILPGDIYDIDAQPDSEETADPLDAIPMDVGVDKNQGGAFFHIPGETTKERYAYTFTADSKVLMEYAAECDGSPNAIAAIAMAKAVYDIYPEAAKDGVDINITINAKPIVGLSKSHWPFLETSNFHFDEKKIKMDDEMLHTCVRGKVFADCTEQKLYPALAGVRILGKIFECIKDEKARKLLCLKSIETPRATANVSYSGASDFGSIGKHIKGLYSFCDAAVPTLEINYNEGMFYFAMSSQIDAEAYMEKLREYFKKIGCQCGELKRVQFNLSEGKRDKVKLGFNLATLHMISGIRSYKKRQ